VFLACFYVLISKINFKKQKYIILMYFQIKNILKINHNHNVQQTLNLQYFLYFYDFILVFVTNTCIWKKKYKVVFLEVEESEKKRRRRNIVWAPPWRGCWHTSHHLDEGQDALNASLECYVWLLRGDVRTSQSTWAPPTSTNNILFLLKDLNTLKTACQLQKKPI